MNDYKGFKSQALDFNVYSDGIDVIAVTPQYALTRENNGIQYYSLNPTTEDGWESLLIDENPEDDNPGRTPTAEEIPAALKATSDAWWADTTFETLLKEYWNKANAYSNTLWTREETQYSSGDPTYSEPREDAGGSAISQWCLDNDRTLINGAHIATGTVTAQQIDTGLLNAAGVVVTSPDSPNTNLLEPAEETLDISKVVQPMKASGSIFGVANTYTLALVDKHAGLRLDLNELEEDQTYKLKFTFTDLSGASTGNVPVTHLGGNIGWPIINFRILRATIDGSPVSDPSSYGAEGPTGGYVLTEASGHKYDIEIEFVYLGMNNPGGIDSADNYFYISPNRCLADPEQTTYTQITITEISCKSCQYILIEQGSFASPLETAAGWTNNFPTWEGKGSVWRRVVTKTLDANDNATYNYGPAQLLTAGECARIMAEKAGMELGAWCKKYEVTIIDGANLMTGTINAEQVTITNLDASQITAGMFTVGTDTNNDKELTGSEIIFQAGYTEGENGTKDPQVKIGGFVVGTNTIASGNKTEGVGIQLTSGQTGTGKVIQAGTKFNVDANGNIEAEGGTIGGWEIKGDEKTLSSGEGTATVGLNAAGSATTPAIWAGNATSTAAPFQVYPTGRLIATSGEIGGFTIDTNSIASGDAGADTGIKLTSGATGYQDVIQAGKNFSVDASGSITAKAGYIGGWNIRNDMLVNTTETRAIQLDPTLGITAYDATKLWIFTFPGQTKLSASLPSVLDITNYEHDTSNKNIDISSRSRFCGTQVYSMQAAVPQWVQTGYTYTSPADESTGENVAGIWFGCADATRPFYGLGGTGSGGGGGLYLDTNDHAVCLDAYGHNDSSSMIGVKNATPSGTGYIRGNWTVTNNLDFATGAKINGHLARMTHYMNISVGSNSSATWVPGNSGVIGKIVSAMFCWYGGENTMNNNYDGSITWTDDAVTVYNETGDTLTAVVWVLVTF